VHHPHQTSVLRGEFFVITTIIDENLDDDTLDSEVAVDETEKIVQRRIP